MSASLIILCDSLKKNYGRVQALRGVDLEVLPGEIFGFLGPNGAGKTTAIRCMLDLIRPNGGTLRVLGLDPQKEPLEVRRRVSYLPGELHLYENMSVEGLMRYLSSLRGSRADWVGVRRLAERLDLDMKLLIKNLSKGNKQKVGVLQALMHRAELLLLDEPTSGLDPLVQQEVLHIIAEARQQGATVFFSSHILSEVQAIAGRVGIIRQGVVVEVAETTDLINRSLRRVRIKFKTPVDTGSLLQIPGVSRLSPGNGGGIYLQVEGEMDELIKNLAQYPVQDFETERPTLEEIFLAYYESENRPDSPGTTMSQPDETETTEPVLV